MRRRDVLLAAAALAGCSSAATTVPFAPPPRRPLIIAHRGASGERPEHTMASYRRAIEQGADFIEPDLVMTKDGSFVCRHENELSGATDIATRREFADRRIVKFIDGVEVQGWFSEDFTLEEIRTLRCRERLPELRPANTQYDGQEIVPTFDEVFALARDESERQGRVIGLYPELKHPTHFRQLGLPTADAMRAFLDANDLNRAGSPVTIQCFEEQTLHALRLQGVRNRLTFLMSAEGGPYDQMLVGRPRTYLQYLEGDLAEIREFADSIGVEKSLIAPTDKDGFPLPPTDLTERAYAARLGVHVWTFRAENYFLPAPYRAGDPAASDYLRQHGDLAAELRFFADRGVDAVFTDFPALAVAAFARTPA